MNIKQELISYAVFPVLAQRLLKDWERFPESSKKGMFTVNQKLGKQVHFLEVKKKKKLFFRTYP